MKINVFKKEFKSFNDKVVKCKLYARVILSSPLGRIDEFRVDGYGKSKCNDEDDFNEDIGKRLALTRAKQNLYKKVLKHVRYLMDNLSEEYDSLMINSVRLKELNDYELFNENNLYSFISDELRDDTVEDEEENVYEIVEDDEEDNENKVEKVESEDVKPFYDNIKIETNNNNKIKIKHINTDGLQSE